MARRRLREDIINRSRSALRSGINRVGNKAGAYINRARPNILTAEEALRREKSQRKSREESRNIPGLEERSRQNAAWVRRRRQMFLVLKYNRKEINQIIQEIKLIMKKLREQGHPRFRFMEDRVFMERFALSLFEKFGNNKFALNKNAANKKIIAKMIMNIEKGASQSKVLLKNNNGTNMMKIEELKRNVIEQTLEQARNPGDGQSQPLEMQT